MTIDLAQLQATVRRTWSAGSARITYDLARTWTMPQFPTPPRSPLRQALITVGKGAGKAAGRAVYHLAARGKDPLRGMSADGVLDLAGRRSMMDYGSYAVVQVDGEQWTGRAGRALDTLPSSRASTAVPLWLLDLLGGAVSADDQGEDTIDGDRCRRVHVVVDLAVASAAVPGGLPSPARDRFDDLLALPVEVWVDATRVRRIKFSDPEGSYASVATTLTLSGFGVDVDHLDWSRLPTFRSSAD